MALGGIPIHKGEPENPPKKTRTFLDPRDFLTKHCFGIYARNASNSDHQDYYVHFFRIRGYLINTFIRKPGILGTPKNQCFLKNVRFETLDGGKLYPSKRWLPLPAVH